MHHGVYIESFLQSLMNGLKHMLRKPTTNKIQKHPVITYNILKKSFDETVREMHPKFNSSQEQELVVMQHHFNLVLHKVALH